MPHPVAGPCTATRSIQRRNGGLGGTRRDAPRRENHVPRESRRQAERELLKPVSKVVNMSSGSSSSSREEPRARLVCL